MPLSDLQLIHAKRVVANDLLRERAQTVGLLRAVNQNLTVQIGIREKELDDARQDAALAWEEAAGAKDENIKLQRKVKRLRGWALVTKVQLGAVVVFGGYQAYQSLMP